MSGLLASLGGFVAAGVSLYQTDTQYREALAQEQQQHESTMKIMKDQFRVELEAAKKSYLVATYNDIERYFQELNENLINCTLDAERDMIDQRNQQFQTLLIAATMMFTSLLSILYQGGLPDGVQSYVIVGYALAISVSLVLLLVTITCCTLIVKDVTRFMLARSKQNMTHLADAIRNTKQMTNRLKELRSGHNLSTAHVVELKDDGVDLLWSNHEVEVQDLLKRRMDIVTDKENHLLVSESFEDHWREHCKHMGDISLFTFYAGTACMLLTTLIFTGAQFAYDYKTVPASISIITTLSMAILLSFLLAFYLRRLDPHISALNEELAREGGERQALAENRIGRWRGWFRRNFLDRNGSDDRKDQ